MDIAKILEKVLDEPRVAEVRRVLDVYGRAPGGLLANGLAFSALFAVVPIALVTLGVAGLLVDNPAVQEQLAQALGAVVPPLAELIDQALVAMAQGAAITSIIGVLGLIWTVSQFYVTIDVAFARIFTDRPERDVLRRTARGFVWVAGLVGVVVALIVAGSLDDDHGDHRDRSRRHVAAGRHPGDRRRGPCHLQDRPAAVAVTAIGRGPCDRGRARDLPAEPGLPVRRPADRRGRRARGFAGHGIHRARMAVVLVPDPARRSRLGAGPGRLGDRGGRICRGGVSPAWPRSAGRTWHWRRVTTRS